MNIIVLVIDTLRYDYLGVHGNDWIQTPNIDRLAKIMVGREQALEES